MKFKLDVPYFGGNLLVIADDNWHSIIQDYGEFGNIAQWHAGFFHTVTDKMIICLPEKPTVGVITHEVNHFVDELLNDIGHHPVRGNVEIECYMLQHFVEKIYNKIYVVKKNK